MPPAAFGGTVIEHPHRPAAGATRWILCFAYRITKRRSQPRATSAWRGGAKRASACSFTPLKFEQKDHRILFTDLPGESPDEIANRAIIELEFADKPKLMGCSKQPALNEGKAH